MKTKTTISICAIAIMMSMTVRSQTIVYDEATSSGIFFTGAGSQVSNPVSDAVNSSANCALSDPSSWSQIQFFPTYTPVSGSRVYFSIYNPSNVTSGQIKFEYTSGGGWQDGGDIYYGSGSVSGWVEYSLSLSPNLGNEINKIILMPGGPTASAVYVDNVYFSTSSNVPPAVATYFFQDAVQNGTIFHSGASELANPLSDAVNSSSMCIKNNGGASWQETQINNTSYVIKTGDKMFISFYNPNNAAAWQLNMDLDGAYTGLGDITHATGAASGWNEVSVDLSAHVGKDIGQIKILPSGPGTESVYYDTIYISTSSTLSLPSFEASDSGKVFISTEGKIKFQKEQFNSTLAVYDLMGRLILNEKINGNESVKSLNSKGIYILRIENSDGVFSQKSIYF